MALRPNEKITKKQLHQIRDRCAELCDERMHVMLNEVLVQEKDDQCSAMLHLLISQNMGQALDMYIELHGREVAEKHFAIISSARLQAAETREIGQSGLMN